MIPHITTMESIENLLDYHVKKMKESNCHIISHNNFSKEIINHFIKTKDLNIIKNLFNYDINDSPIKKCVQHISLNFHPNENINTTNMKKIAEEYMQKMGHKNKKYIIFKHNDKKHQHLHIVFVKNKNIYNEYKLSNNICYGNNFNNSYHYDHSKKNIMFIKKEDILINKYNLTEAKNNIYNSTLSRTKNLYFPYLKNEKYKNKIKDFIVSQISQKILSMIYHYKPKNHRELQQILKYYQKNNYYNKLSFKNIYDTKNRKEITNPLIIYNNSTIYLKDIEKATGLSVKNLYNLNKKKYSYPQEKIKNSNLFIKSNKKKDIETIKEILKFSTSYKNFKNNLRIYGYIMLEDYNKKNKINGLYYLNNKSGNISKASNLSLTLTYKSLEKYFTKIKQENNKSLLSSNLLNTNINTKKTSSILNILPELNSIYNNIFSNNINENEDKESPVILNDKSHMNTLSKQSHIKKTIKYTIKKSIKRPNNKINI